MTDWIAWTRCRTCGYTEKEVFQKPHDAPPFDATSYIRCPKCGNPARQITFPAFEIQTIEISPPSDSMYETMDDW
jgi:predicted nucleic-acid-binding Zn-ribbon protein